MAEEGGEQLPHSQRHSQRAIFPGVSLSPPSADHNPVERFVAKTLADKKSTSAATGRLRRRRKPESRRRPGQMAEVIVRTHASAEQVSTLQTAHEQLKRERDADLPRAPSATRNWVPLQPRHRMSTYVRVRGQLTVCVIIVPLAFHARCAVWRMAGWRRKQARVEGAGDKSKRTVLRPDRC